MTWNVAFVILSFAGCVGGPAAADPDTVIGEADVRVLFIGNSLTAFNDLPGLVGALALAGGHSYAHETVAVPNFSLEDHANSGIEAVIGQRAADIVVLQQGPSSLPESREHLVLWSSRLAKAIRAAGRRPALLMVWPPGSRFEVFDDVRDSYLAAARAVEGLFIPAGETWREAWERDPTLDFYGADGFHPTPLGSLAAALTVYAVLFEPDPSMLRCPTPTGLEVPAEVLEILCESVRASLAANAIDAPIPVSSPSTPHSLGMRGH